MAQFRPSAKKLAPEALFDYGVRALSRRALTERELRDRLARRASRPEDVDRTVERLREIGYLDDARTAESHAFTRKEFEGLGRRRVLSELQRRGIDAEVAEQTVDAAYQDADELELIRQYLQRRLGARFGEPIEDQKELARLYRGLLRAGYSSAKIGEALRNISSAGDWLDEIEEAAEDM